MARTSLEKDSLGAKIKEIKSFITPNMAKKLTFEDAEALSSLADTIQELLSNTLSKLVPNALKNSRYNVNPSASYKANGNSIYAATPSNAPVGIASITEQPQLAVSGDLGTGFNAGGISLFDVTEEVITDQVNKSVIKTLQAQNPGVVIEEKPMEDELGRLNDIFASVEDVQ